MNNINYGLTKIENELYNSFFGITLENKLYALLGWLSQEYSILSEQYS